MRGFHHSAHWQWLTGTVVLLAAAAAVGQPPDDARVAALIRQLGSLQYSQRKAAFAELAHLGRAGRPQLAVAAARADDLEVRLQAQRLLRELNVERLWAASRVAVQADQTPLPEVIYRLGADSGNWLQIVEKGQEQLVQKSVSLAVSDGRFWPVLDTLCRQTEMRVRPRAEPSGVCLRVEPSRDVQPPTAYAGSIRARLVSARRRLTQSLDFEQDDVDQEHRFEMQLQAHWEAHLRPVAYGSQPLPVRILDEQGHRLTWPGDASRPHDSGWEIVTRGDHQMIAAVALPPPPMAAQKLSLLELSWPIVAVGDVAEVEIPDPSAGKSFDRDDVQVDLEQFDRRPGNRYLVRLRIRRDLVLPEPRQVLLHENAVELLSGDGRPFYQQSRTAELVDGGARLRITFRPPEPELEAAALKVAYPRLRSRREISLIFRDVPLPPVAR